MSKRLLIEGGQILSGDVRPGGFKHALVTCCAAALVGRGRVKLLNVPDIEETRVLSELLNSIGGNVTYTSNILSINLDNVSQAPLNPQLTSRIHGAIYLLPGLLSRFGRATLPITGGCQIDSSNFKKARPINHYIDVLRRFGANAYIKIVSDKPVPY